MAPSVRRRRQTIYQRWSGPDRGSRADRLHSYDCQPDRQPVDVYLSAHGFDNERRWSKRRLGRAAPSKGLVARMRHAPGSRRNRFDGHYLARSMLINHRSQRPLPSDSVPYRLLITPKSLPQRAASIIACFIIVWYDNDDANGKWINITFGRQRPQRAFWQRHSIDGAVNQNAVLKWRLSVQHCGVPIPHA